MSAGTPEMSIAMPELSLQIPDVVPNFRVLRIVFVHFKSEYFPIIIAWWTFVDFSAGYWSQFTAGNNRIF